MVYNPTLSEMVALFDEKLDAKRCQACAENDERLAETFLNLRDRFRLIRTALDEQSTTPRPKTAASKT